MGDGLKPPSPWHPITDTVDLKHLGKLAEEVNELIEVLARLGNKIARTTIQGLLEINPTTGKTNKEELENEIADVDAGVDLLTEHFHLDCDRMLSRKDAKVNQLRQWHIMA